MPPTWGDKIVREPRPYSERLAARVGDLLYLRAESEETGIELWRTDGSSAGTFLAHDVCPGPCDGVDLGGDLVPAGEHVVFEGNDGLHGLEPWAIGPAGATLLVDFCPGPDSSEQVTRLARVGDAPGAPVVLAPRCHDTGQLLVSDGTADGTLALATLPVEGWRPR